MSKKYSFSWINGIINHFPGKGHDNKMLNIMLTVLMMDGSGDGGLSPAVVALTTPTPVPLSTPSPVVSPANPSPVVSPVTPSCHVSVTDNGSGLHVCRIAPASQHMPSSYCHDCLDYLNKALDHNPSMVNKNPKQNIQANSNSRNVNKINNKTWSLLYCDEQPQQTSVDYL